MGVLALPQALHRGSLTAVTSPPFPPDSPALVSTPLSTRTPGCHTHCDTRRAQSQALQLWALQGNNSVLP